MGQSSLHQGNSSLDTDKRNQQQAMVRNVIMFISVANNWGVDAMEQGYGAPDQPRHVICRNATQTAYSH